MVRAPLLFAAAVLLSLALAAACVKDRTTPVEQSHERALNEAHEAGLSKMVMPECEDRMGQDHPPSEHTVRQRGNRTQQRCGMVTFEVTSDDFFSDFLRDVCRGVDGEDCAETYRRMFFARIAERYPFADWDWVLNRCDAYPARCQQFAWIELWALESHNEGVIQFTEIAMERATAEHRAAYSPAYLAEMEERRRRADAIGAAFEGLAGAGRDTVTCTTTGYGATATTTCR